MQVYKQTGFMAAHRLPGHPKCGRLHGHNWRVEVWINGEVDPMTDMVVDFGVISELAKRLDHKCLLDKNDDLRYKLQEADVEVFDGAPTCERLAQWFADELRVRMKGWHFIKVKVWESEDAYACYQVGYKGCWEGE